MPTFRQRILDKQLLIAPMLTLCSAEVAELLSHIGYDWIFVDEEHGTFDANDIQNVVRATAPRTPCLIRVASASEFHIKKSLDVGAAGIIAPMVNSPELAQQVVNAAKYSPQGTRGIGIGRAHTYGLEFDKYIQTANEQVVVVVQAEHIDAVQNIESIVEVVGIDAVLVGPFDLSASLGRMGEVDHPQVVEAIQHVERACQIRGISLGIFGVNPSSVQPYIERGFNLIIVGADTLMLGDAARKMLAEVKR